MFRIICVTNRRLCREDFLLRIEKIAKCAPDGIILREKDLQEEEYKALASKVMEICGEHGVPCILHGFVQTAAALKAESIHVPLHVLRAMSAPEKAQFQVLGASCHSAEDAQEAEKAGCAYVTAGHIFKTDSKKGLPPRGLEFLNGVCRNVTIPVFAIGGIGAENLPAVRAAGASGACVMGDFMRCEDVSRFFAQLKKAALD